MISFTLTPASASRRSSPDGGLSRREVRCARYSELRRAVAAAEETEPLAGLADDMTDVEHRRQGDDAEREAAEAGAEPGRAGQPLRGPLHEPEQPEERRREQGDQDGERAVERQVR